jgi:protein-S-isoprenylcysteine O-methyltransferase Ste14
MKTHSHIFGYLLGLVIFVIGIPALMVLVAENDWIHIQRDTLKWSLLALLAIAGLALSIWSIVYMRRVGEGNPFDAFNHEVAPRTKRLLTDGPYAYSRNPMLVGIYVYHIGWLLLLMSIWPVVIFIVEVILLTLQVRSEEKRLEADFGEEYLQYKAITKRY